LKGDNKYATYVKQVGLLFENIQLVNPTAIMHAFIKSETVKLLGSKSEMSDNMTIFLGYAPVGGNSTVFKFRKNSNKKKGRHGKDEPDMINLSIYPTLIFSSDVDPDTITSRVMHEFCWAGRFYFRKKELQCIETCTPFIIYYLYTLNDLATIRYELSSLIRQAYKGTQNNFILPEEFEHHQLPKINIHQGVPKLPRQSGQQFRKYMRDMQEARQAHLIECDTSKIPFLCALINYIKEHKLAAPIWGGHAHITEPVDWDSPKGDLSRFGRMSQDHKCYNMSIISVKVQGISDIKKTATIYCPTLGGRLGELSLRQTLMKYSKLPDGSPLCTEIHQRGLLGQVDIVIPNTADAEESFEMFNKQPAGYLYHILPTFGASLTFIQEILRRSMDPVVAMEARLCTWDNETGILTTPKDNQIDGFLSDVHSLPFFQDVLAATCMAEGRKSGRKNKHTAPDMCFSLGGNRSIQTINGANDGKYMTTTKPGAVPGIGTQASAATSATANQQVIELNQTDGSTSKEESDGERDDESSFG
jgi:hypothetical protein